MKGQFAALKITPLTNSVPEDADALMQKAYALLPHLKITELLMEVDEWTGFTVRFTHIKSGDAASDKTLLLTTILADAINLGLTKMAESCPGTTYAKLSWLQAWHIRNETYSAALADLVNAQFRHPFAGNWGEGTTSSSDGQRFKAGGHAEGGTVYLERAIQAIKDHGDTIDENLLQHLSPLGWEHINLTGDYVWRQDRRIQKGKFRALRSFALP
jgi:hypothetical protein